MIRERQEIGFSNPCAGRVKKGNITMRTFLMVQADKLTPTKGETCSPKEQYRFEDKLKEMHRETVSTCWRMTGPKLFSNPIAVILGERDLAEEKAMKLLESLFREDEIVEVDLYEIALIQ